MPDRDRGHRRARHERDRRLGDDDERPLRAGEERCQIERAVMRHAVEAVATRTSPVLRVAGANNLAVRLDKLGNASTDRAEEPRCARAARHLSGPR